MTRNNIGSNPSEPVEMNYPVIERVYEKINIIGETSKNGAGDPAIEYGSDGHRMDELFWRKR